jgi:hypothetical protein
MFSNWAVTTSRRHLPHNKCALYAYMVAKLWNQNQGAYKKNRKVLTGDKNLKLVLVFRHFYSQKG